MSSYLIITEVSVERMALRFVQSEYRVFVNFATPQHWTVGDTVALEVNRPPYPMAFDSESRVQFSLPKELPQGWDKGFYRLRNETTDELFALDFDGIKGWEGFVREAKRRSLANGTNGKNKKVMRGSRVL
jgi:hypothetical protein